MSTEATLIQTMIASAPHQPAPAGPGDDASLLEHGIVITTDTLVEGVHFVRPHPPRALGWKALAANFSDVAAMGATASGYLVAASLPQSLNMAWWEALSEGMGAYARAVGARLHGGDITRSPGPVMITITAWGALSDPTQALTRRGGCPGDLLMIHGHLGRSRLGLERWLQHVEPQEWARGEAKVPADPAIQAHLRPQPPLNAGPWALAAGARAGMDLSDGLLVDGQRLAVASDLVITVALDELPEDEVVSALSSEDRIAGGEDYALAVLVPLKRWESFADAGFQRIGYAEAAKGRPAIQWTKQGLKVSPKARPFLHFETS